MLWSPVFWIGGRKVTIFSDHKSLESWYKEDLCTMAGPSGRRGRWHKFLSRYNIVVVYKPGKDNVVADGLSRWAYPAGEADDTNFQGSDADLEGVSRWEAKEKAWELEQLSDVVPASPEMSVQAVRLQFAADKRRLQGAQAASSVFCALYVAAWLQQNHGVLLSIISSPSPDVFFPSSTVCMLHSPLDTDTVSQCSTDEGSLGPTSEMAEALQELISAHVDCSLETTELDGQVCQVFKQCTHTPCMCPSKRGPISQTRRRVQPVRARQQFVRQLLTQGYTRTAHAMIAGCTAVKIPPACRVL